MVFQWIVRLMGAWVPWMEMPNVYERINEVRLLGYSPREAYLGQLTERALSLLLWPHSNLGLHHRQ